MTGMKDSKNDHDDQDHPSQGDRARPVALALLHVRPGELSRGTAPGVLLTPLPGGATALARMLNALSQAMRVKQVGVVLASASSASSTPPPSEDPAEAALRAECQRRQVPVHGAPQGEPPDPLAHLVHALRVCHAGPEQVVVRVTADCPLIFAEVVDAVIETLLCGGHDYVSTDLGSGVLPVGLDVEATYAGLLYDLDAGCKQPALRERVTAGLHRPAGTSLVKHRVHEMSPGELDPVLERCGRYYASFRLSLRGDDDRRIIEKVVALLDQQQEPLALASLLHLLDQHPEWRGGKGQTIRWGR